MNQYEIDRIKEDSDKKRDYYRVQSIVKSISIPGWIFQAPKIIEGDLEHRSNSYGHLFNQSLGGEIWLSIDSYGNPGKVVISGCYPRDFQGKSRDSGISRHSINVSENKSSDQMAKDIERRFLPLYLPDLAKVQASIATHEAWLRGKVAIGNEINAAVPGLTLHNTITGLNYHGNKNDGSEVTLWNNVGELPVGLIINCHDKCVELTFNNLSVQECVAAIGLIRSMRGL